MFFHGRKMIRPVKSHRGLWVSHQNFLLFLGACSALALRVALKRPSKAKFFVKKIVKNRGNCVGIVLYISHYRWRKLKGAGKTTVKGEETEQDVSLYLNFLLELRLSSHMLLFIFKPVILLKIVHFYLYIQKKVNITFNSWITSYPSPH